jgi:hypothetical protein
LVGVSGNVLGLSKVSLDLLAQKGLLAGVVGDEDRVKESGRLWQEELPIVVDPAPPISGASIGVLDELKAGLHPLGEMGEHLGGDAEPVRDLAEHSDRLGVAAEGSERSGATPRGGMRPTGEQLGHGLSNPFPLQLDPVASLPDWSRAEAPDVPEG